MKIFIILMETLMNLTHTLPQLLTILTLTANGRRQKLNFLASVLSRLYTKVKIFSFTVNKSFFPIFLLD